jgi:hypothetical protein
VIASAASRAAMRASVVFLLVGDACAAAVLAQMRTAPRALR